MISEGLRDNEDWINETENSAFSKIQLWFPSQE